MANSLTTMTDLPLDLRIVAALSASPNRLHALALRYRRMTIIHFLFACCCLLPVATISPLRAEEKNAELKKERELYDREVEFAMRPIRERYLFRLDKMKRTLGGRGDARGALAVQEEMDNVATTAKGSGVARFAGTWALAYTNGTTNRHYGITPAGVVTWIDENGKPFNVVGKVQLEGSDFTIRFPGDERVERITIAPNGLLIMEHFALKGTYPKGVPVVFAVGIRSQ